MTAFHWVLLALALAAGFLGGAQGVRIAYRRGFDDGFEEAGRRGLGRRDHDEQTTHH